MGVVYSSKTLALTCLPLPLSLVLGVTRRHSLPCSQGKLLEGRQDCAPVGDCVEEEADEC